MDRSVRKDVRRRYERMLKEASRGDTNKGRVNCYTCIECGKVTKTIDIDDGVTPMGIECPYCNGDAMSSFYEDIVPDKEVSYEWYRPSLEETLSLVDGHFFTVNHILSGGLIRRRKDA